ncbi:hypothetical protein K431DRAFT_191625, partial [Polychaeton citri CBS 116435]
MQFKGIFVTAAALFFASGVIATAADPYAACQCPNNCSHKTGDSCAWDDGTPGTGLHSG